MPALQAGQETTMEFGNWLRQQRRQRGWSAAHLARLAGVSQACVSSLEGDAGRSPTLATAERLTLALGMPLWEALREMSAPPTSLGTRKVHRN